MRPIRHPADFYTINNIAKWFITALALIAGLRYIKMVIEFVLLKLYEIFVQGSSLNL